MIVYEGERTRSGTVVRRRDGDHVSELPPRFDLANHSPSGFEWGYGGSGPAQLALALLADALPETEATTRYQSFKWAVVARLPWETWSLSADAIREAVRAL